MKNLHFPAWVQYDSKRSEIDGVRFDVLRGSQQRALFMVGGLITSMHDSICNPHNDLKLEKKFLLVEGYK